MHSYFLLGRFFWFKIMKMKQNKYIVSFIVTLLHLCFAGKLHEKKKWINNSINWDLRYDAKIWQRHYIESWKISEKKQTKTTTTMLHNVQSICTARFMNKGNLVRLSSLASSSSPPPRKQSWHQLQYELTVYTWEHRPSVQTCMGEVRWGEVTENWSSDYGFTHSSHCSQRLRVQFLVIVPPVLRHLCWQNIPFSFHRQDNRIIFSVPPSLRLAGCSLFHLLARRRRVCVKCLLRVYPVRGCVLYVRHGTQTHDTQTFWEWIIKKRCAPENPQRNMGTNLKEIQKN